MSLRSFFHFFTQASLFVVKQFLEGMTNAPSFFEYIPVRAAESHTWIEITHCGGVYMHHHEKYVFWAYITPGSGVFMHTGRTAILRNHLYFPWQQIQKYQKFGFDTIQYTRTGDHPCGKMPSE